MFKFIVIGSLILVLYVDAAKRDVLDLFGAAYGPFFQPSVQVFPTVQLETSSALPEIIINRQARPYDPRSNRNGGYIINRPSIPFNPTQRPQLDPEINNEYLPPTSDRPFNDYLPPPTPSTTPIPPQQDLEQENGYFYDPPDNSYIPPASGPYSQRTGKDLEFFRSVPNSLNSMKVELKEMNCMTNPGGYFKAQMKIHDNVDTFPVVEHDTSDPRCEIKTLRSQAIINVVSDDFGRCGIYNCAGNDLCLRVRFPLIRGLRTRDDLILTLQCKLHERVVGKTHTIKLGVNNVQNQGRSNDVTSSSRVVAQGGGNQQFRSQVGLFRKTDENGFSQALTTGSVVQLGEELMIRAQVRTGDGWNYTRLSDVALQRFSPQGELLNSVNLVSPNGCLNHLMRSVCPHEPVFEAPLGYKFGFKAFMFQGMKSGDELVMNVKLNGCLYKRDCIVEGHCLRSRGKRDLSNVTKQDEKTLPLEIAHLLFRVELPDQEKINESEYYKSTINYTLNSYQLSTLTATGLICVIGGLILIAHFIKNYTRYKVFV